MTGTGSNNGATWEDEEQSLFELARRDPRAFAPLYQHYFDSVHRYAMRRLGDRERAADTTSQVFLNALAALPGYRAGSFQSWLFTIAHNVLIDALRANRPETGLEDRWALPAPGQSPEEMAIGRDDQRQLAALFALLTPDQRNVMELRLAGLTGQEIADQLGRGLAATKSIQWRAFERLRRALDQTVTEAGETDFVIR